MVGHALADLPPERNSILFIENVGNLVCPAGFDLGETEKVAILSVAEGDDKPLKYPDMFAAASTMVLSKIDLLPHVDFDVDRCIEHARSINPGNRCSASLSENRRRAWSRGSTGSQLRRARGASALRRLSGHA